MSDFTIINDVMRRQLVILNRQGHPIRTLFRHEPDYKNVYQLYMEQQDKLFRTPPKETL